MQIKTKEQYELQQHTTLGAKKNTQQFSRNDFDKSGYKLPNLAAICQLTSNLVQHYLAKLEVQLYNCSFIVARVTDTTEDNFI